MQTARAGVIAQKPVVVIGRPRYKKELEAYWENEENKKHCRGENLVMDFIKEALPKPTHTIGDFGCGTGRGGLALAAISGCTTYLVDFAENCLDEDVANACVNQNGKIQFINHDIYNSLERRFTFGYVVNLLDSIPEEDLLTVLKNLCNAAERLYIVVNLDKRPFEWWVELFQKCAMSIFLATQNENEGIFYASSWLDAEEILKLGTVNVGGDVIAANILTNIKKGIPQCTPHLRQEREVVLLGGGPSLNQFEADIREKREKEGAALITCNGTYHWALERNLHPSAQVVVDAREFNERFIEPVLPKTKYLLASQCHPELIDKAPKGQTLLWHAWVPDEVKEELTKTYGTWYTALGGCTVLLRSLSLLRMLGYYKFHIYGFDSCLLDGEHHAYEQLENENETLYSVSLNDKTFICTSWMVSQAQEFMSQTKILGDDVLLAVYGNGLIANMLLAANQEK